MRTANELVEDLRHACTFDVSREKLNELMSEAVMLIERLDRENEDSAEMKAHLELLSSNLGQCIYFVRCQDPDYANKLGDLIEQRPQTSLKNHNARIAHEAYVRGAKEWKNTQEITLSIEESAYYYTGGKFGVDDSYLQ